MCVKPYITIMCTFLCIPIILFQNPDDGSYDNWALLLQFINNVIDILDVGELKTRIGLVAFSTYSQNIFYLNTYKTKVSHTTRE